MLQTSMIQRVDGCIEAPIDGELVLMSMSLGNFYGLDGVASELWQTLAEPISLASLQQQCRDRFEGNAEQIDADVKQLMEAWFAEKLIRVTS